MAPVGSLQASEVSADMLSEFRGSCASDPRARRGDIPNLDKTLGDLHRRGREAWPDIDLPVSDFVDHLAHLIARIDNVEEFLTEIHVEELYLAAACTGGDERAIARVMEQYFDEIGKALARLSVDTLNRDDLEQELRLKLFVARPGKRPKVASYSGRGRMRAWLRVVATRCIVDMLRAKPSAEARKSEELDLQLLPDTAHDPELAHLKALYRDEFSTVFQEAIAKLTPKQRNLLRHNVVRGLSIDEIGAIYGCHRATAARWLSQARRDISRLTRASLTERLRVNRDELDSIWRLVQSQLDISICRFLIRDEEADNEAPEAGKRDDNSSNRDD